ncbi:hypothetical protein SLS58_010564 [Diplodia intermedia]|uniref:Major facilitator superfamily (MFS) profile domain-containing protein n=1 Tax=Diplodia intermedia TaxID=856260 RepID=A0ABR3T564_9PEZI
MSVQTADDSLPNETRYGPALFCSVGLANAFGVFQAYYISHQLAGHSDFDISWIGSIALGIMFANAPIVGVLVDRVGARLLLISGSTGLLLSVFMTSLASSYYQFILAQAVLQGLSMSFTMFPAVATISKSFHKNRGLALGITIGGSSIGGLIWPIVLNELLNQDGLPYHLE